MGPMRVYSDHFEFNSEGEFDIVDLTSKAETAAERSEIREGIAVVYSGHTTGIIILNENEPGLLEDVKKFLRGLIPAEGDYRHLENGYAHLRSMLLTPSRVIPVHGGRLGLGTWQSLYWVEADRQSRRRRVEVTVIGE